MSQESNNLSVYHQDVLGRFAQARAAGSYGEALIWVGTAAILDSPAARVDPHSAVNTALFQLVYDSAAASEALVLKCGNATTTHGDLIGYGLEAIDLLVSRLDDQAADGAHALAVFLQGHFNSLFEKLGRHFDRDRQYLITTGAEAKLLLDTTRIISRSLAEHQSIKVESTTNWVQRAVLLQICLDSPDYEVLGFPLRFLSNYDKSLFFIEGAQLLLAEFKIHPEVFIDGRLDATVTPLEAALAESHLLTASKSNLAKASYLRLRQLGSLLPASLKR